MRVRNAKGSAGNLPQWINEGEKYALIGLSARVNADISDQKLTPHLWVLSHPTFSLPAHWRDWLGSIRVEEVEEFNLFLLSKQPSLRPGVLDSENETLKQHVRHFYVGLLLVSAFAPDRKPVMLTGCRQNDEIDVREQQDFECPVPLGLAGSPPISREDIHSAAELANKIHTLSELSPNNVHRRLFRTLFIYVKARATPNLLDRIHQYCRCIEGLILPDEGKTRQQFKSRTELFVGPHHHIVAGDIYDVRCAVEHLHEDRYLDDFDRQTRLDLLRKEALVELIARKAIARIVQDSNLWPHFANKAALKQFWNLEVQARRSVWGDSIDLTDAIANFNSISMSDRDLGAP